MSHLIGRRGHSRETYPGSPGGASVGALRNRNVASPTGLVGPFTPATTPSFSLVAAILYTPQVSGVVMVTALLDIGNGGTPETYGMAVAVATGTNLSVTGGASTSNGWVIGSTVPPVVGGSGITLPQDLGISTEALAAGAVGDLAVAAAISQPLPVGVPVVIEILLNEAGGGHALASLAFTSLSILELP